MNYPTLTDEQNEKLHTLKKETEKAARWLAFKSFARLTIGCGTLIALNELYVHNLWFVGIMSFVTGICAGKISRSELQVEEAKVQEKFNNIVNN